MSTSSGEARQLLTFPSTSTYLGFLLTCFEEPMFSAGSEIYERCLNRVFAQKQDQAKLQVVTIGDPKLIRQLQYMAVANGGKSEPYQSFDRNNCVELTVSELLRRVRLQTVSMEGAKFSHLLIALYNADAAVLSDFLKHLWNLGARGIEAAFVKGAGKGAFPSHFVRMYGMRYSDAFRAWCDANRRKLEVYTPLRADRRTSRFYVQWGYRHPLHALDQLAEMDSELVLLRPKANSKSIVTEWITFQEGTVNFFRKAQEFTDLQVELTPAPLIELEEDPSQHRVPIELAIVHKPKTGPNRIWQLDQQIDRQRSDLQELEMSRARLATGEHEEVYFAYRFDQEGEIELNPRLIRLLQQRIGTLNHYDYAYCRPQQGKSYHLVISNRTQRHMGFSLQPADRVYYQPAPWRQWGVNLYLPLRTELAPRVDSSDALPILQRFLEGSQGVEDDSAGIAASAAIFWELGRNDCIEETRVQQTAPLLSQFRLLNSFQREIVGQVEQGTQQKLIDGFRAARKAVDVELDGLTRDLLEHVGQRAEKLQTSFAELDKAVRWAEKLVKTLEPRVQQVRDVILNLPDQWIEFVNRVVALHRALVDPEIAATVEFRERLIVGRGELRALAARNHDLSKTVVKHHGSLSENLTECDKALAETARSRQETDVLLTRATVVFNEIGRMHKQLGARIQHVKQVENKAQQMQQEIDQISEREAEVARRMDELVPLHAACGEQAAQVSTREKEMQASEQALARKSAELARRREDINLRLLQVASQMERIEVHLNECSGSADRLEHSALAMDEQTSLVDAHTDAIQMWEAQEQDWRQHLSLQHGLAEEQIQQLKRSVTDLENYDVETEALRIHVRQAKEHIDQAEAIAHRRK